jgi:hypothetical protein
MSLVKIVILSFLGFTAILLGILLALSFILPQRPEYVPTAPMVEISSPVIIPSATPPSKSTVSQQPTQQAPATPLAKPTVSQPTSTIPQSFSNFRCAGKTHCSHMTSCEEAKFYLRNCPGVKIDGNHDGIPCEKQWCNRNH